MAADAPACDGRVTTDAVRCDARRWTWTDDGSMVDVHGRMDRPCSNRKSSSCAKAPKRRKGKRTSSPT